MAKRKVNKSEKIREAIKANPNAGPTEISKLLADQGVKKVSITLISNVKTRMGARPKKRGRPAGRPSKGGSNGHLTLNSLMEAKQFVDHVGSLEAAAEALEALASLR